MKAEKSTSLGLVSGVTHSLKEAFLDTFFPRTCVACGDPVDDGVFRYLCESCARELFLVQPPACSVCGFPFFGVIAGHQVCPHCAELNPAFDEGKALFLAKGPGRSLIHELKYHQGFYVFEDIRRMLELCPHFLAYLKGATLVPVPLHPVKKRERGYNQSERIAQFLSQQAEGSSVKNLLQRREFTKTQTRLNRDERHRNVKNAFALASDAVVIPTQQYILIDDVFTTGSTLNACAATLREAGAEQIKVATLGHG